MFRAATMRRLEDRVERLLKGFPGTQVIHEALDLTSR